MSDNTVEFREDLQKYKKSCEHLLLVFARLIDENEELKKQLVDAPRIATEAVCSRWSVGDKFSRIFETADKSKVEKHIRDVLKVGKEEG